MQKRTIIPAPSAQAVRDAVALGGLFHCTSVAALRQILRDGYLRPASETGAPARGAGVASRCRRLGGVCLFDVLPQARNARARSGNPGRSWLGVWLTSYRPVTVAIRLDAARLRGGSAVLTPAQARGLASGLMLRGEVCHLGPISLSACASGFLFARRSASRAELLGSYWPGSSLTTAELRDVLARVRQSCRAGEARTPADAGRPPTGHKRDNGASLPAHLLDGDRTRL